MVLIIEGQTFNEAHSADEVINFIYSSLNVKEHASDLLKQEERLVPPPRFLYVSQREYAVVSPSDDYIKVMGTGDATTCHMVVIRHTASHVTSLAHFDGCDTERGILGMVEAINEMSSSFTQGSVGCLTGASHTHIHFWVPDDFESLSDTSIDILEVHLVGGFLDERNESVSVSSSIIKVLLTCASELHLATGCITKLNDMMKGNIHFPVIYGIGVEITSGEIFKAKFPETGPDLDIRGASHFTGCHEMFNIYVSGKGILKVGPFSWKSQDGIENWLTLPDYFIRKYCSTSPDQEPSHFAAHVRACFKVIADHPEPDTTLFAGGKPRLYLIQPDGQWLPVQASDTVTKT